MNRLLKSMLITCITIGFSVNNLSAQEAWEELAEQLIDEEGGEVFQWENNFEELSELRENPININTATKEQLERFPFLSDKLIENILADFHPLCEAMLTEQDPNLQNHPHLRSYLQEEKNY